MIMTSRGSITSRRLLAAAMGFALAWIITAVGTVLPVGPAAARNLQPILGCGTATEIGNSNLAPLYVDGGCMPQTNPNIAFTNIKICAPGSKTNCQVIDHVQVDTGSVGLRLSSSAVNSSLLQAMTKIPTSGGQILTGCAVFGDGSLLYGPIQTADVYIANKFVKSFPVQVTGQNPPVAGCGVGGFQGPADKNGLLGIALELSGSVIYYSCNTDGSNCAPTTPTTNASPNLVSKFQNDNNGVAIALSQILGSGSVDPVLGLLIFGIGTHANNTPPVGTVPLQANSSGFINLQIGSSTTIPAIIDSGTSVVFVPASDVPAMPQCNFALGLFCPSPDTDISLGLSSAGVTTPAINVRYTITDADTLVASGNLVADNDFAGDGGSGSAILGLSFFFGKTMYFVFAGQPSPLGTGPINAMWPQGTLTTAAQ